MCVTTYASVVALEPSPSVLAVSQQHKKVCCRLQRSAGFHRRRSHVGTLVHPVSGGMCHSPEKQMNRNSGTAEASLSTNSVLIIKIFTSFFCTHFILFFFYSDIMCPCGAPSLVKSPQLMKRTGRMHACRIKSRGCSVFGGSGDECTYSCLQQYTTKSIFCGVEQHKHEWEKQSLWKVRPST